MNEPVAAAAAAAPEDAPQVPQALGSGLLAAIARQLPEAVVYADREGLIRWWNGGAEALFGFPAEEVVGRSLDVIIPERLRAAHWAGFRRAIDSGRVRPGDPVRTTRSLHKDGRTLYVDMSFGIVADATGAVAGAVAVGRDCTQRYLADKARRTLPAAADHDGAAAGPQGAAIDPQGAAADRGGAAV